MSKVPLYGGLELGGTTIRVCLAEGLVTNVVYQQSHPTRKPTETLQVALDFFKAHPIVALGIGSFGPVDLNPASPSYGHITSTPKLAWVDVDVVGFFSSLHIPISFNTDVNGVALAEMQWGGHERGLGYPIRNVVYVTVGTGVGAGVVVDGKSVSGLLHPEAGHFRVPRHPDDRYPGNCFPESDTRVLTNHGFLFLDEIEALIQKREEVLYGCYELTKEVNGALVESKELQYCAGELVLPEELPSYLVELTEPGEAAQWAEESGLYGDSNQVGRKSRSCHLSLRVTPDHEMFVQTGSVTSDQHTEWDEDEKTGEAYRKMTAESLVSPTDFDRIRLLACAENGYQPRTTPRRDAVQAMLGMSDQQFAAFIELLGFWLGDGTMKYSRGRCNGVEYRQLKGTDVTWLQQMLPKAGLDERDYSQCQHKNGLQQLLIRQPDWCAFFHAEFGDKYVKGEPPAPVAWKVQTKITAAGPPSPQKKAAWAAIGITCVKGRGRRGAACLVSLSG